MVDHGHHGGLVSVQAWMKYHSLAEGSTQNWYGRRPSHGQLQKIQVRRKNAYMHYKLYSWLLLIYVDIRRHEKLCSTMTSIGCRSLPSSLRILTIPTVWNAPLHFSQRWQSTTTMGHCGMVWLVVEWVAVMVHHGWLSSARTAFRIDVRCLCIVGTEISRIHLYTSI